MFRFRPFLSIGLICLVLFMLIVPTSLSGSLTTLTVQAQSLMVTNTNDSGLGSLRNAFLTAPSGVTITFDPTVFNTPKTITLTSGPLTIQGSEVVLFYSAQNATVSIFGLTIQHGSGRIVNAGTMTISNSLFSGNTAGCGGGIANAGKMTISNTFFSANSANCGGGIYNTGTLTVSNSTFSGNSATNGEGGGIYNAGTLTVSNSTFYRNSANFGGGIYNAGTLTVSNSTVSGNYSVWGGAGIASDGSSLNLGSSIIAGNITVTGIADLSGVVTSLGNNLIGGVTRANSFRRSDRLNIDPMLNPLALNPPTKLPTMSLQAGSPAIGKGSCNLGLPAVPVTTDERELARKAHCDIGAYETHIPNPATLIAPSGTISSVNPTFTWHSVTNASRYYVWVSGAKGQVLDQWFDGSKMCTGGTCSVTPTLNLSKGAYTFSVMTWANGDNGPVSSMTFKVSLAAKPLPSPTVQPGKK